MRVGIHQINYLPWMGYFNKMAKSDLFILLDEVQLTDSEMMQRNRVLNKNGKTEYITIPFQKKNYFNKKFRDIEINNCIEWQKRQYNFLYDTYHKFDYWQEVINMLWPVFNVRYNTIYDVNLKCLNIIREMLDIKTEMIMQSELSYNRTAKKDDLIVELCSAVKADIYLSGAGAKKYMDNKKFNDHNILVQYQTFIHPSYKQTYSATPILGLSILDILLNCGIKETKDMFYSNIQNNESC